MIALRYTVDPFPASPAPQGGFALLESVAFTDLFAVRREGI